MARWFHDRTGWSDSVLPSYSGAGIANLVGTVTQALGCDPAADSELLRPLAASILDPAGLADARVVILVVLDGYGSNISNDGARLAASTHGKRLTRARLTSVFPSTTAAALTSLQTGVAPGRHGVAGYTLHLPDVRRVVNMILFSSVDGRPLPAGALDPASLLPVPTIYQRLADVGIESVVVSHAEYARSPLTILHSGDTTYRSHRTAAEFTSLLRREAMRPGKRFVFGYWAGVDMLAHSYGPSSAEVKLEAALLEEALSRGLLQPLANGANDVVVVVTADHGLTHTPEESSEALQALAKAAGKFPRPPTGERRAVGLSTSGASHRERLALQVGERGVVCDTAEAAKAGLFGPEPLHDELIARVGDSLLLARDGHSFPFRPLHDRSTFSLGAHGSLTPDEMYVPLLAWRFGPE